MSLQILTTLDNVIDANILRTKLESEGIPCILNNENFTNLLPHFYNILGSGVQVMVPAERLDEAREIANLDKVKITCPKCDSDQIQNDIVYTKNKIKLFFIAVFLTMPIGNLLNSYTCKSCGERFRS